MSCYSYHVVPAARRRKATRLHRWREREEKNRLENQNSVVADTSSRQPRNTPKAREGEAACLTDQRPFLEPGLHPGRGVCEEPKAGENPGEEPGANSQIQQ
ncbi:hypothetical protein MDA_GLEAN10015502 [Myotis davidii]|uniref:Uncharacterized protein n=1 Tax=Myotis davidii TaxID=225400 RepID=L5MAJ4_MYODS|nr:hypothetical protein MDA_GLEAN10015502 [Myotis davidii]